MNVVRIFGAIVICFLHFDRVECFIPWGPLAGGLISAITGSVCRFKECCSDYYIPSDLDLLKNSLETELHDQHLAVKTVQYGLKNHIESEKPKKALVMSFHGSSGIGKNLMVNLIVDALYKEGAQSNYVHYYNGHLDFYSEEKAAEYKRRIEEEIKKHLGSCPRSIFIFDEVDHMPRGMLDDLLPFLDYNPRLCSVDPTQAIFIFVSNIGAASIEEKLIEMWQGGKKREETKLANFELLLAKSAFNKQGGLHETNIIKMNLIDHYVPFLPFEQTHVRKCVESALEKSDFNPTSDFELTEMIDEAMTHMTFGPPPHNLYSETGCKRVNSKVSAIVERSRMTNPFLL